MYQNELLLFRCVSSAAAVRVDSSRRKRFCLKYRRSKQYNARKVTSSQKQILEKQRNRGWEAFVQWDVGCVEFQPLYFPQSRILDSLKVPMTCVFALRVHRAFTTVVATVVLHVPLRCGGRFPFVCVSSSPHDETWFERYERTLMLLVETNNSPFY